MRTSEEIEGRIRLVLREELERRVSAATKKLPRTCVHNHRHPLDTRRVVDGEPNENYNRITSGHALPVVQTIGLCMYGSENPEQWGGTICEDPIDAQRCPFFTPKHGREEVIQEFKEQLGSNEWVKKNLPEVESLRWVLADEAPLPDPTPKEDMVPEDTVVDAPLPWWQRLLARFGLRLVRVTDKLLPPG
jgi:hypothetical protein